MNLKRLFIFRHGETDWNAQGRFQGHTDIPLNEVGRKQAQELMLRLRPHRLQAILSSDLSRALETAQIVAQGLDVPVHTHVGLREAHLGDAQGMTYEEILQRFGDSVLGRWRSDLPTDADVAYPGGESGAQVMERVFAAMNEFLLKSQHLERIGISCHGGVIRRIMQALRPPGSEPVKIPNVVLYEIEVDVTQMTYQLREQSE